MEWSGNVISKPGRDPAIVGVPPIRAVHPRVVGFERCEEIVDPVRNYDAVVRGHEERYHHAPQPGS